LLRRTGPTPAHPGGPAQPGGGARLRVRPGGRHAVICGQGRRASNRVPSRPRKSRNPASPCAVSISSVSGPSYRCAWTIAPA
jgi:hypothetical protein